MTDRYAKGRFPGLSRDISDIRSPRSRVGGTTGGPSVTPVSNQISKASSGPHVDTFCESVLYVSRSRDPSHQGDAVMKRVLLVALSLSLLFALPAAPAAPPFTPWLNNSRA